MAHERIDTFVTSGTFTAPVTGTYLFFGIGGGGGGKAGTGGGGGGGSSWVAQAMNADETADIVVGTSAVDTNGGDTTVTYNSTVICRAKGGLSRTNGATGGQAVDGVGSTKYSGGSPAGTNAGGGAGTQQDGADIAGGAYFGGNTGLNYINAYGSGGEGGASRESAGHSGLCFVFYDIDVTDYPEVTDRAYSRNSGTSHVITMPTSEVGDLLLCMFASDSTSTRTFTPTSGWTKLAEQANSGTQTVRGGVYYKFATSSNSLTITSSVAEESAAICYAIKYGGTPTTASAGGSSTNPDCPEHTIASAKALWIAFVARDLGTPDIPITAPPSGYKDFQYLTPGSGNAGADMAVATLHYEGTTQNPGAFTAGSEQWAAFTIAIPFTGTTKTRHRVTII